MEEIKNLIREVLEKGYVISLGTSDEGGVWVTDLVYVHDEQFNIYWFSYDTARHSVALLKTTNVAGTITLSASTNDKDIGLQIEGVAEKVHDKNKKTALAYNAKKGRTTPWLLKKGQSWYRLKPKKIELIYEPLFGFEKKMLQLKR
ncbi:MAG TPA: pyridoxamine 5'-phosphate oxidase family protein [Candidatus Nanoarchaeia archaeon]|nr:pyridoxamine 5'-phosphate oxidase family protein [Candidatus Nanoarchaeia archaeon]